MGSVKNLEILRYSSGNSPGVGRLHFTDRYSIFDYGSMPDMIVDKGKALALIGAFFFELFEENGINTRYRGIPEAGTLKRLADINHPPAALEVDIYRLIKPTFDGKEYRYPDYSSDKNNLFIPLEFIYRNTLPPGASVFSRIEKGELTFEEMGLDSPPLPGEELSSSFIDVSTKLEEIDRYPGWEEAGRIAGLSSKDVTDIKKLISKINRLITDAVEKAGFNNYDGKVELGFDEEGNLSVSDLAGTPDESRLVYKGLPANKDILRDYYRNSPWYESISEIKELRGVSWLRYAAPPPPLKEPLSSLISDMYKSVANAITGRDWFDSPDISLVIKEIDDLFSVKEKKV